MPHRQANTGAGGPQRQGAGGRPDLSGNYVVLMVFLTGLTAMGSVSMATYLPAMHAIAQELKASLPEVQGTISAYLIGYAVGNLIHGPLADRFGRKPVLIGSFSVYFLASVAASFVATVEQLSGLRALQGLAACAGPILGRTVIRDSFDGPKMSRAFSILSLTMGIAPAIGPMIGGVLQGAFGWQASFVFMSVYSGLILLVGMIAYRESRPPVVTDGAPPPRIRTTVLAILRNRHFMGWAMSFALGNAGWFIFMTVSPFIFMDRLGVSATVFGVISVAPISGFILGNVLQRRFMASSTRQARVLVGFVLILAAPAAMVAAAFQLSIAGVLVPMFVYMLGIGVIMPNHMAYAMEPFPQVAGTASTLLGFAHLSMAALASTVAGAVYADSMVEPAMAILGFSIAGTLVVALTRPWRGL